MSRDVRRGTTSARRRAGVADSRAARSGRPGPGLSELVMRTTPIVRRAARASSASRWPTLRAARTRSGGRRGCGGGSSGVRGVVARDPRSPARAARRRPPAAVTTRSPRATSPRSSSRVHSICTTPSAARPALDAPIDDAVGRGPHGGVDPHRRRPPAASTSRATTSPARRVSSTRALGARWSSPRPSTRGVRRAPAGAPRRRTSVAARRRCRSRAPRSAARPSSSQLRETGWRPEGLLRVGVVVRAGRRRGRPARPTTSCGGGARCPSRSPRASAVPRPEPWIGQPRASPR